MSGPKTSRYTLTEEQRRILAELRKIEQRKAAASEKIKRNSRKILQVGGMFNNEKQVATELLARTGSDGGFAMMIKEMENLISPIQPIIANVNYNDVEDLERTADKVESCLKSVESLSEKIALISSKNEINLKSDLQSAIDEGFETSFADIKEVNISEENVIKDNAIQKLTSLKHITFLNQSHINEIHEVLNKLENISDKVFVKNYVALTVNPLLKKIDQFVFDYNECHQEFESIYAEYVALCEMYYYVAQEYECSNASIEKIKAEIERIKQAVAEDEEQYYISECLDEVMEEMGYTVIGRREVTKKSGKHFRNELYTYDEGTAVNITYSSDGRIAMELGGIDTSDRVPNAQETEKLCESMEHFCDDFKEIEKRLLKKGVVLKDRLSLLPPSADYAQIINTVDYDMKVEAEKISVKKQHRSVTKQKALAKE